jgi:DNA-binding SARP family transcriptional activator
MRWAILGPLLITDDEGCAVALPAGRVRVLLAVLLTRANHTVPLGELVELVWDACGS